MVEGSGGRDLAAGGGFPGAPTAEDDRLAPPAARGSAFGHRGASLVLLDEVGAGTDPTEGAALAAALLGQLADRARLTVATTRGLREWLAGVPYVERVTDAEQGDGGMGCSVIWVK